MWLQVLQQASEKVFVPLTVGGGIREFTDADGKHYSALDVAAEYFRSGADKVSIGGDAVFAAEEFYATGRKSGKSSIEQISWVRALSLDFIVSGLLQLGVDLRGVSWCTGLFENQLSHPLGDWLCQLLGSKPNGA